jgi:hypothetical protein
VTAYTAALILLAIALPFVVWPLVRPRPDHDRERTPVVAENRGALVEEIELDAASGRLSEAEARARISELEVPAP